MRLYAFYFPQFYATPENDFHWGEGFTDWDNVKSGKPLFDSHYQPRVPLDGYYDQSNPDIIVQQVELAKKYKINGFSFYHYWFDGSLTLEKPAENFLANKDLDLSFNFTWANETWSKRWVGLDDQIIFQQTHSNDVTLWRKHFDYLLQFWLDERYEKVDGKPIFNVYNPHLIENSKEMFSAWNNWALESGLLGIHFVAILVSPSINLKTLSNYDGVLDFQPRYSTNKIKINSNFFSFLMDKARYLPEPLLNQLTKLRYKATTFKKISYSEVWDDILNNRDMRGLNGLVRYYGGFVDWDNTARYKDKATIYIGGGVEVFKSYFQKLYEGVKYEESIVYINAWNEWSEGTYLEPDLVNKYSYLEAISDVVEKVEL